MEIKPALEKLFSLHQFGIKLGLESTLNLLVLIGNPHRQLKCFHIAGSNGKGSTASFITSILMEHGYKVGLYTSPHFVRFNERIKINGKEIADEVICKFVSQLDNFIEKNRPTFFELTTALAFKYFEEEKVDYAVIETGLGGRLDSTNVIDPVASVITSISLEHTLHLGDSIEKIAFEKAGIIKKGKPVFVGNLPAAALQVIEEKVSETGSELFRLNDFSQNDEDCVDVQTRLGRLTIYETPLKGAHQLSNSALAVKTIGETMPDVKALSISRGVARVISNTKIEGRYEVYSSNPRIIFDSAHNPEGVQTFINEFRKEQSLYSKRVLIFGAMRDKNINEMLISLVPYFDKVFITSISDERAAKFAEIKGMFSGSLSILEQLDEPDLYIRKFAEEDKDSCLVVLGSMYLLGEIKSKIL